MGSAAWSLLRPEVHFQSHSISPQPLEKNRLKSDKPSKHTHLLFQVKALTCWWAAIVSLLHRHRHMFTWCRSSMCRNTSQHIKRHMFDTFCPVNDVAGVERSIMINLQPGAPVWIQSGEVEFFFPLGVGLGIIFFIEEAAVWLLVTMVTATASSTWRTLSDASTWASSSQPDVVGVRIRRADMLRCGKSKQAEKLFFFSCIHEKKRKNMNATSVCLQRRQGVLHWQLGE